MSKLADSLSLMIEEHSCLSCGHNWTHSRTFLAIQGQGWIGGGGSYHAEKKLLFTAYELWTREAHPGCWRCIPAKPGMTFKQPPAAPTIPKPTTDGLEELLS